MPMDKPQSLTPNEVYAVSAYILNLNGLIPADAVMDQNTLPKVKMPNAGNFYRRRPAGHQGGALHEQLPIRSRIVSAGRFKVGTRVRLCFFSVRMNRG